MWRGKKGRTWRKTLRTRTITNKKLNPLIMLGPGFEPRTHGWEASALTTAPPLLAMPVAKSFIHSRLTV